MIDYIRPQQIALLEIGGRPLLPHRLLLGVSALDLTWRAQEGLLSACSMSWLCSAESGIIRYQATDAADISASSWQACYYEQAQESSHHVLQS
jgi:hypothetical protein